MSSALVRAEEYRISGGVWLVEERTIAKSLPPVILAPIPSMQEPAAGNSASALPMPPVAIRPLLISEELQIRSLSLHHASGEEVLLLHSADGPVYSLPLRSRSAGPARLFSLSGFAGAALVEFACCPSPARAAAFAQVGAGVFVVPLGRPSAYAREAASLPPGRPRQPQLVAADVRGLGSRQLVLMPYGAGPPLVSRISGDAVDFEPWRLLSPMPAWSLLAAGYFNKDEFEDILLIDSVAHAFHLALSDGKGGFRLELWQEDRFFDYEDEFLTADLDGDGLSDLIAFRRHLGLLEIFPGGGTGAYTLPWRDVRSAAAGDLNCDGIGDLAVVHSDPPRLAAAFGRSTGPPVLSELPLPDSAVAQKLFALAVGRAFGGGCAALHLVAVRSAQALAEEKGFAVSGMTAAAPLAGVQVAAHPAAVAVSDERGNYRLRSLPPGEYRVAPVALGSEFEPPYAAAHLRGGDISSLDFVSVVRPDRPLIGSAASIGTADYPLPQPCLGYRPADHSWGRSHEVCPAHHAVMEIDDSSPGSEERNTNNSVLCCPLPSVDILTNEHRWFRTRCPEGWLVTSGTQAGKLRCTKINDRRYQLSTPISGAYWGLAGSYRREARAVRKANVPPSLRFGMGRRTRYSWDSDGCVGERPGALLTGTWGKQCSEMEFRELQWRGGGAPVEVLPPCDRLSSKFDPAARCLTHDR